MFTTMVDLLRWRSEKQRQQRAFTFLVDGDEEEVCLSYAELDDLARRIAALLQRCVAPGERAILLYPPGLEFVAAFFACLYARIVAVPSYPPDPGRLMASLHNLQAVVQDSRPAILLTIKAIEKTRTVLCGHLPELNKLSWLCTDSIGGVAPRDWKQEKIDAETVAFLQYTSGSTTMPKGVVLRHSNLMANQLVIQSSMQQNERSSVVGWLPLFHDMGLIGNVVQAVYLGFPSFLMSPLHFLQQPYRWLRAISRFRATISGGPNFAYDLCARRITQEQRAALDLSSWEVAFNGSEPVRSETLNRFSQAFGPCGFRREAFYPCYGLAEASLMVSGGDTKTSPLFKTVDKTALESGRVAAPVSDRSVSLVSSGRSQPGHKIEIVDPESCEPCEPGNVGEIWVSGPSVAREYWNRRDETESTFQARLAGTGKGPFLRTGDLGFCDGEDLFVVGRLKDVIVVRGRKLHPQDMEMTVERSDPTLRPGGTAVFGVVVEDEERLVVVSEIDTRNSVDIDAVLGAVRQNVVEVHQVRPYAIVMIRPRSLPKTSSGKVRRQACKKAFSSGTLEVVAEWRAKAA